MVVVDTHMGSSSNVEICTRIRKENASQCTRNAIASGLFLAKAFLPTMETLKLVMECINHYNLDKTIIEEGRTYADLS